jgi:tetratricopeptide (TPR) repeat protein
MPLRIEWRGVFGLGLLSMLIFTQAVFCIGRSLGSERVPLTSVVSAAPSENEGKQKSAPDPRIADLEAEEFALAQKLIQDFPHNIEAIVLMGDVYRRWGDIQKAQEFWERALQMDPNRFDINGRLAQLAFENDDFEKSVTLWKKVLQANPTLPGVHLSIARHLIRMGEYEQSIGQIEAEIGISGQVPLNYFLLGQAYEHLRDYRKAEECYCKVIELQPGFVSAYYGLVTVYSRLQEHEKAKHYLTVFKRLKARPPGTSRRNDPISTAISFYSQGLAQLCRQAAMLYDTVGNRTEVEILLKRAISLRPLDISSMEKLITLYTATDRLSEALELYRQIQTVDPDNVVCRLRMGRLLSRLGHSDKAEKAFKQAITIAPDDDRCYLELARFYLKKNVKLPQAKELALKAVALKARPEGYFVLAQAYDITGDPADALTSLERAMELDPNQLMYKQIYRGLRKREGLK